MNPERHGRATTVTPKRTTHLLQAVLLFICFLLLLPGSGCVLSPSSGGNGDGNGNGNGGGAKADRSTRQKLLEDYFKEVYNSQDSTGYEAMLDDRYEFENLPADPDDPLTVESWDKADELRIAGRMFSGWENPEGKKVQAIDLRILFQSEKESNTFFQDQPDGETWYDVVTEVDLTVTVNDPAASDGSGIVNKVVFSNQNFVVRPDPDAEGMWVIRRQVDQDAITKR